MKIVRSDADAAPEKNFKCDGCEMIYSEKIDWLCANTKPDFKKLFDPELKIACSKECALKLESRYGREINKFKP